MLDDIGDFFGDDAAGEMCLAARAESDGTGCYRKKRMVAADCDIFPRFDDRAALADDNHAGARGGAVSELHAEIFRV